MKCGYNNDSSNEGIKDEDRSGSLIEISLQYSMETELWAFNNRDDKWQEKVNWM